MNIKLLCLGSLQEDFFYPFSIADFRVWRCPKVLEGFYVFYMPLPRHFSISLTSPTDTISPQPYHFLSVKFLICTKWNAASKVSQYRISFSQTNILTISKKRKYYQLQLISRLYDQEGTLEVLCLIVCKSNHTSASVSPSTRWDVECRTRRRGIWALDSYRGEWWKE